MRLLSVLSALLSCTLLLAGCSDPKAPESESVDVFADSTASKSDGMQQAKVTQRAREVLENIDVNPCELLTDDIVRAHLPSAMNATIERRISEYSMHPLCVLSWRKPDADAIEAGAGAAMQEYMQRKMRGEDVKMPTFRTNDELTLTLFEPVFEDARLAHNSFDQAMAILQKGVTGTHEGGEVTFQSDVFEVGGVGDKASWAEQLRQLSVVHGGRIFYVTVNTGADNADELATAIAVAKDVQALL